MAPLSLVQAVIAAAALLPMVPSADRVVPAAQRA
jgi:hypothetical protein